MSVIVPVFNEAGNIPEFLRRVVQPLTEHVRSYEIIFCVDPSTDGTEQIIRSAHRENQSVKMIRFSRRFGQPMATLAGLEHCRGDAALVMDVDLQDPPELIPQLVSKWREGFSVVYARRLNRKGESYIKKLTAKIGYGLMNRFADVEIPRDTGDFRIIDRKVIEELRKFPETHGFLRGLVALVGYEQTEVVFERPARHAGKGNYNRFLGSLRIGMNGIIGFSSALLNLSTILGFAAAGAAFMLGIAYATVQVIGQTFPIGNPTIVVVTLFVAGLQLICLGITGQYIGRIYEEVKRRPRYLVADTVGIESFE